MTRILAALTFCALFYSTPALATCSDCSPRWQASQAIWNGQQFDHRYPSMVRKAQRKPVHARLSPPIAKTPVAKVVNLPAIVIADWAAFISKVSDQIGAVLSNKTAVYSIADQALLLPNGERLEAHSGLGHLKDNPKFSRVKNRGVTPPNVYKLSHLGFLFYGTRALRMSPENAAKMYGRDGILAHPYLAAGGQSQGCMSVKDYARFLRAFNAGEIDRVAVVERLT